MRVYMYSIYDKVAEVFNKPFQDINDASAIRGFTDAVKNEIHKNDYELYLVADFNNNNGQMFGMDSQKDYGYPRKVISGLDIKVNNVSELKLDEDGYPERNKGVMNS